jgi:glycosyltransferase involved in cell wall biosynthesis
MKIAILGSRGIPVSYGGFETLAEEISTRLVRRGHNVTVYCCAPYSKTDDRTYKGVKRIVLPSIRTKVLEKAVFALLSLIHASFKKYDLVLMLGTSVSFFCFLPRWFGKKVVINIDGLEWQRRKWGPAIASLLKLEERMAGITANELITDSRWVQEYYRKKYGKTSAYIGYGTDSLDYPPGRALKMFGLEPEDYILYVSRFEPENNALLVREAYDSIENPPKKLIMVGDAPYADAYKKRVKDTGNPRIIFAGYQYGDVYRELLSNAYVYIQATEVGGTHPALVEAMGAGNCVLANDVPEHREVLRDAGFYYKGKEDLKEKMVLLMGNEEYIRGKQKAAVEISGREYSWEKITDEYEQLFLNLVKQ